MPPGPKLGVDTVIEIATEFLSGAVSIQALAERYDVCNYTIRRALAGEGGYAEMHRYLPSDRIRAMLAYRTSTKGSKLTPAEVVRIRLRFRNGATTRELSDYYGVSQQQVRRVVSGESHAMVGGPVYKRGRGNEG